MPSLLARTGSPEPGYVPTSFNDRGTGLYAAHAIVTALFHRERSGEAQHIEVPMFESMAQFVLGDHMGGMAFEPPMGPPGYPRTLTAERRPYQTADGYVCAIIYTDNHWRSFGEPRRAAGPSRGPALRRLWRSHHPRRSHVRLRARAAGREDHR